MTAKERNALAAASRGKPNPNVAANRAAHAERMAAMRDRQNRHTLAAPVTAPAGFRGSRGRRPGTDKGQGEWRVSPYYSTHATRDIRWSDTASAVSGN